MPSLPNKPLQAIMGEFKERGTVQSFSFTSLPVDEAIFGADLELRSQFKGMPVMVVSASETHLETVRKEYL